MRHTHRFLIMLQNCRCLSPISLPSPHLRRHLYSPSVSAMRSAQRFPIMQDIGIGGEDGILGAIEASATRSPSMPNTLHQKRINPTGKSACIHAIERNQHIQHNTLTHTIRPGYWQHAPLHAKHPVHNYDDDSMHYKVHVCRHHAPQHILMQAVRITTSQI